MILLSRLIKSSLAKEQTNEKIISIKYVNNFQNTDMHSDEDYKKIVDKANLEAAAILETAEKEAAALRELLQQEKDNWQTEKNFLIEEAHREGYQAGIQEGQHAGYSEYAELLEQAKSIIEASRLDYENYINSAETEILELGMKVAEKVVQTSITENKEHFLQLVKKVLKETRDQKEIQLHVNPIHYQYLLSEKDELLALFPIKPSLFIFPDESTAENDCIIETANGRIEASVDTQLLMIKQKLLDLLESE